MSTVDSIRQRIETQVWEANPERPGYQRLARRRTIGEVYAEVRGMFGEHPEGCEEYLVVAHGLDPESEWPDGRIVVFPVTGDSEGHYIHVEVQTGGSGFRANTGESVLVMLGKTFAGWDPAWYFARRLAERLGV